jgi:hypothetical protein
MPETQTGPALDPERMEGQEIAGCKIVAKIATGGMGTVYRALQVSMNRQVAIKCLAEDFAKDQAYVTRFVREARAAGELSHTNLIHVLDVGVHHGVYYYLMEFVDGQSLDRVLRIKEKLGPETAVEIMIQAAKALSYAHTHEIIHRDVKPDNLMITTEGTVKIADLGIAKKMDRSKEATDAGLVLGTPNYMAPEQATDASLTDKRSDIYALGSTAYHMLTGKPPYTGKNALEILTSVVKKKPEPIEKLRKDLPKSLVSIINKMMARDPERRYQAMDDLVKDLELFKAGKYKSETPSTRPTWDDEEEAKPKAEIELAATPEEEAKRTAALAPAGKAAGPATVDNIKLSGTRVVPNPAMAQGDLIGAKAIGAINAKQASKMVPLFTLVGAIVIGLICWYAYRKLTEPEPKKAPQPSAHTEVIDTGPQAAPGETEAKEALADAEKIERRPNVGRADVLHAYKEVDSRWPETLSAGKAREVVKRLEKEWTDAVDTRLDVSRKYRASMPDVAPVTPALDAVKRARSESQGRADLLEKVKAEEAQIDAAAVARKDKILATARELARQSRWVDAITEARKVFTLEYPQVEDEAIKEIGTWRLNWRGERESADLRVDGILEKAMPQFHGTDDPKDPMQPERAAELVTALTKDSSNLAIKSLVDDYAAIFHDGSSIVDAAFDQAKSMAGQKFKFSKASFANDTEVTIVDVARPKVQVQMANGSKLFTKPLAHEDILKLAKMSLGSTDAGKLKLASYWFARGDAAEALKAAAGVQGAAGENLRHRFEDYMIRRRELQSTPRDLIITGGWNEQAQKGGWTPKERGAEIEGSGDLGERLLQTPPESNYIIEVDARKVLGPNGFGVYFKAFGLYYDWEIGDGGNQYSLVRGLPGTQTADVVAPGDPAVARIVVLDDKVIGYLNFERRWEIQRSTPGNPAPTPGMGLSVSHTLVRFIHVRLWELK